MVEVTVVMPTFNDRRTVAVAVNSILEQTLSDWELIIVDDASTDGTCEVLDKFRADSRITVLHSKINRGSGCARNRAIAMATGKYLAVMDADDISLPNRLQAQALTLNSDRSLVAVSSQVAEFGDWGGPEESRWPTAEAAIAGRQRAMKVPIPHPATMFRIDDVRRVGGYDETCRRAQDFALFLKLSDQRMSCLPDVLLQYRTQRPLPLEYAMRNGRYAALARKRYELSRSGVPAESLPSEPGRSLLTDVGSVKSWIVRNFRERTGL